MPLMGYLADRLPEPVPVMTVAHRETSDVIAMIVKTRQVSLALLLLVAVYQPGQRAFHPSAGFFAACWQAVWIRPIAISHPQGRSAQGRFSEGPVCLAFHRPCRR